MNAMQGQFRHVEYLAHMLDAIRQARSYVDGLAKPEFLDGQLDRTQEEMMGTTIAKRGRIGARVPQEVYETLCRAAELTGATVNQFLVRSALKEAQAVIEREKVIPLSPRDWNVLLDLMENTPRPNAKLKAAMKRYQKSKRDDCTSFIWEP